jgi:hypothetical protein
METSDNKRTTTTIIILIVTALLIGGVVFFSQQNNSKEDARKTELTKTNTDNKQSSPPPQNDLAANYKAGDYNATGHYQSPGGEQEIKVSVTLDSDGKITDTSAQPDNKSSDSRFYQGSFISNYKDKVVGKKIDEVKLDHVGASSLTPGGFNDALEDIKNQAKA